MSSASRLNVSVIYNPSLITTLPSLQPLPHLQPLPQLIEPVPHGAVDDGVTDAYRRAADHAPVDDHLDLDVEAQVLRQRLGQLLLALGVEGDGGAHLGDHVLALGGSALDHPVDDRGQ